MYLGKRRASWLDSLANCCKKKHSDMRQLEKMHITDMSLLMDSTLLKCSVVEGDVKKHFKHIKKAVDEETGPAKLVAKKEVIIQEKQIVQKSQKNSSGKFENEEKKEARFPPELKQARNKRFKDARKRRTEELDIDIYISCLGLNNTCYAKARKDGCFICFTEKRLEVKPHLLDKGNTGIPAGLPKEIKKYFARRYTYFEKFDEGIEIDTVGWYSVSPEELAKHVANRFKGYTTIVDLCSGVGGNSIQFAACGSKVIGVEIDEDRVYYSENNATVYGVQDKIKFIKGDALTVGPPEVTGDVCFCSPPWGGPEYGQINFYSLSK